MSIASCRRIFGHYSSVVGLIVGTFPPFIAVAGVVMVNVTRPMVTDFRLGYQVPFRYQLVHFQRHHLQ
jgi:hypothetical protein